MNGARLKIVGAQGVRTSELNIDHLFVSASFLPSRTHTARTQNSKYDEDSDGETDYEAAGLTPTWNENLRLQSETSEAGATALILEMFVEGMITNELVGNCVVDFADGYDQVNGRTRDYDMLGTDGSIVGKLTAMISLTSSRQSQAFEMPAFADEDADTVGELASTPKASQRRRTTILNNCHKTLAVEIIRAGGIQNLNMFTNMDPYCKAALLPTRKSHGQTPIVEGGGTDPEWDDGINDVWVSHISRNISISYIISLQLL